MMIIKLFEEYNNFYTEITNGKFNDESWAHFRPGLRSSKISFTGKEINIIKKEILRTYKSDTSFMSGSIYQSIINDTFRIHIFKLEDEYYLISYTAFFKYNKYYRCDQLDGLLKCLEDINPI